MDALPSPAFASAPARLAGHDNLNLEGVHIDVAETPLKLPTCHGPQQRVIQAVNNSFGAPTRASWVARSSSLSSGRASRGSGGPGHDTQRLSRPAEDVENRLAALGHLIDGAVERRG
jgi:hypothetical protein